jgi:hypothetical protein
MNKVIIKYLGEKDEVIDTVEATVKQYREDEEKNKIIVLDIPWPGGGTDEVTYTKSRSSSKWYECNAGIFGSRILISKTGGFLEDSYYR